MRVDGDAQIACPESFYTYAPITGTQHEQTCLHNAQPGQLSTLALKAKDEADRKAREDEELNAKKMRTGKPKTKRS